MMTVSRLKLFFMLDLRIELASDGVVRRRNSYMGTALLPDLTVPAESSLVIGTCPLRSNELDGKRMPSCIATAGNMRNVSSGSAATDTTYGSDALDVTGTEMDPGEGWTLRLREADEAHLNDL